MSSAEVSESEEELQSWYDWIGHRVSISGVKFGILRYFGETQFASGIWCGVELDEPVGKNNGNVKGVQYFTCEDKFGIFAPLAKTSKIPDGDKCIFMPKKSVKSKLPSKVRQNLKQNDSKIELRNSDFGKTIAPPSLYNVNNTETSATNELFKKLRRHSEAPGDCRRLSSGVSKHLNNSEVYDNLPTRKIGLPLNPCYPRNLNECKSDFLNQTVTIEQTEIVSSPRNELDDDANLSSSDANLLNKTIEISSPKVLCDAFQDRRDSTFILDAINRDANKEVCRDSHCDGNEDMSVDFDESLGILSPSEMKDFTLSFENACVSVTPRQPGIPKNESCDDVNDLPESEVIINDETVITTDSKVNNHVNTFCKNDSEDTLITLANDELFSKSEKESFVHHEGDLINRGFSFVHGVDEVNNLVPFSSNTQSDLLSSKQQHVGESFNANEALDYLNFSSALGSVQSHSTSSIATSANNAANERHVSPVTDNAISKFLIDLSTLEGRTTNSSLTNFTGDKTPEGVTVSASCNLNSMLNSSKQHNRPLYQKTLLRNYDSRLSFTPILDEKMPNYALNISELDKSARNSLSFLGVSPSENNTPKDLINFSYGSPLIQFSPSSVTDTPKLNKLLISSMRNNDQDLLPEVTVVEDSTTVNDSVSNVNKEAFPVLEPTATVTVENLEDLKLINLGMESNCDVVLTMPDLLCNKGLDEHMLFTNSDSKTESSASTVLNEANSKISNTNADKSKAPSHFHTNEVVDKPDLLCYNVEDTVFNSNNLNTPCSTAHAVQLVNLNLCQETTAMEYSKHVDLSEPVTCDDEKQKSWYPLVELDNFTTNQTFLKHEVGKSSDSSSNPVMGINTGENAASENPVKAETCNLHNVLNQTICLNESVASSPVENCQLDQQPLVVCPLSKTCSNEALENLVISESEKQVKPSEKVVHELGKTSERKAQPVIYQSSVDLNANCPNILGAIEDISIISGDGTCFEVSDVFESIEGLDRTHGSSDLCDAMHEEASLSLGNSSCSKSKNDLEGFSSTKTVFPKSTAAKTESKVSTNAQITAKPPKKNVVSKIKLMLEANKSPPSVNQENISVKNPSLMQKKTNKRDAITSKINSGVVENKTPKPKKDVPSRINTNLARHSTPKVSLARNNFKNDKQVENKPSGQELNASKDGKNNQKPSPDKVNTGGVGAKRESRILTQLQNVDSCPQPNDRFKVPVFVSKKKSSALSSPTGSANTESSAPLSIASKIASIPKKSGLKVPSNFKSTKPEVPGPTQPAPRIRSSVGGKVKEAPNKESKVSKWAKSFVKPATPRVEPRKFVSKTELVREIQELGVTCENRTKELNLLKIRLRHATLGFEAFAILNKYMVEEFDPFAQPQLAREYKRAKKELSKVGELLHVYQTQLTELKAVHAEEIMELTEKLGVVHDDEITELKCKHIEELAEVDLHYKTQIKQLKETFKKQAEENEEQNCQKMRDLQADYERQKRELQETHSRKLEEVASQHEEVQRQLQEQIRDLNRQYNSLQKQLKEAEEAFMKDKNSKIQYISAKKTELEKEVDSLKAVLDIKTTQIQDLHKENFKIKKELEELPAAKEKIRKLEVKTEDLKALMQEKVKLHRELSSENQQLVLICEKEAKANNRLSMENEELQWRLQQSVEASIRSASLCGSPDLWNHDGASFDDQRCSSRMSLPILQSELPLGLESSPATPRLEDRPGARGHSMSLSWHPSLPTHVESPLLTSTPQVRERSRSARGGKLSLPTQSKLSTMKLKRDIESEILRRNSSVLKRPVTSTPSVVSHPMSMSWGGESFADYYEEVDESCVQICADQSSGLSRKFFVKYDNNRSDRFKRGKRSMTTNIPPDPEIDIDKSMSGLVSLQTSYTSSTDSSSSFLPTQPGSEASSSSSSSGNKSQESNGFNDPPPACVKPPRELAGESMVQEVDSLTRVLFQENGRGKKENGSLVGLTDMSSSSPEDGKDNAVNLTSMATPSIETSSQGMADSTNLDVSWGDEEMPSEND